MKKEKSEVNINLKPKKSWGKSFPNMQINQSDEVEFSSVETSKSSTKLLDRIVVVSITMLFFGVPLFFTNLTFQGIIFEKQIFFYFWIFIALIAWTVKGIILGEMKIKKSALDIPIGIFWLAYLLATIFSVDKWHSFWGMFGDPSRGLVGVTALIIVFYLIRNYLNMYRFKIFVGALICSGSIVSIWSLINILQLEIFSAKVHNFIPFNLVGSALDSGIFLTALIPLVIVSIFKVKESKRISGYFKYSTLVGLFIALALFVLTLVFSSASSPWIGVLIGLGFILIFLVSRIIAVSSNNLWLPMAIFVIAFSVLMVGVGKVSPILQFFNVNVAEMPASIFPNNRLSLEISTGAIKDNFALGSGPATYGYAFSKYKPQSYNLDPLYNLRHTEGKGIFFEYASTIGLLGIISFLILVFSFLSVTSYLLIKKTARNKLYSLGLFSSGLILLVDFALYPVRGSILIIGVLIATLALTIIQKEGEDSREGAFKLSLKTSPQYALVLAFIYIVICIGAVVAFVFLGKVYIAEVYAGQALRESKISVDGSISKMNNAIELYGKEARYFSRVGQEYMFLVNQEALKTGEERDVDLIRGYINAAIEYTDRGRQISPNNVVMIENLAQVYKNTGYYVPNSLVKAEEYYNLALELEPHNPIYYLELGQIKQGELGVGEKEDAEKDQIWEGSKELFEKAVAEKINYDLGYYNLALAESALKNVDGAISAMEKAFLINPRILEYRSGLGQLYVERGTDDDYKAAEEIFLGIQSAIKDNIGNLFNLGFLYEKMERRDDAIFQYEKILSLLPEDNTEAIAKIKQMIRNTRNGIENTPENLQEQPPIDMTDEELLEDESLILPEDDLTESESDFPEDFPEDMVFPEDL